MPHLLERYIHKRNFKLTPEPKGNTSRTQETPIFVIQKHAASHLHYDFRLEAAGVLKSWAVPKGPSTDPHVKRLAVQVEDHPLDYAGFEGIIPRGQYGGGNVIVWDKGTYQNTTYHKGRPISLMEGLKNGHISITLNGRKIHGGFALTRMGYRQKPQWLLIKTQDENANKPEDPVQSLPKSVLSGRTIETISEGESESVRQWNSNRIGLPKAAIRAQKSASMPGWIEPMLATLVDKPFDRDGWIYEPKLDGERCLAYCHEGRVKLFTRNHKTITPTYPEVVRALERQGIDSFILDGEIVAFEAGTQISSFKRLQQRMHLHNFRDVQRSPVQVHYYLFDILALNNRDLRTVPLLERKTLLERTIKFNDILALNPYVKNGGKRYYQKACHHRWEGLIAKRENSHYTAGRSHEWLKFKCVSEQEFVIGGYTDPKGSREKFGAILIGYYQKDRLKFAGKVGTGFDRSSLQRLTAHFRPLERKTSPFDSMDLPKRGLHWLEPKLVAEIRFSEWTDEGKLRQPRYIGLRDDRSSKEVTREIKVSESPAPTAHTPSLKSSQLHIDGKDVNLSHLNKVFYPSVGFTKGKMLDYYIQVAPLLLPHLRGRPLTLKRYPDGIEGNSFYEKQAPSYRPSWLRTFVMEDEKTRKKTEYCVVDDLASLVWIANLATVEMHSLLARAPAVDRPTLIAFDMDPGPPAGLLEAMKAALRVHRILEGLNLKSFPKTSGGKGLHIYIPLNKKTTYAQTQEFAHAVAILLERQYPKEIVSNMRKELRRGKVLVDWSQNTRHKTTVTAYSLRAQSEPIVSTPVTWEEIERAVVRKDTSALRFTAPDVLKRISKTNDLFAPVQTLQQKVPRL